MNYVFRYRRRDLLSRLLSVGPGLAWRKFTVRGHALFKENDRMILYFPGGGVQEVVNWSECEIRLGPDWALAQQKALEKQAGQAIPVETH